MRNGSGHFDLLPEHNPVVSGQPVSSDWANETLADVAAALTDSLCIDGQSTMTGALRLATGTGSAPSMTFGAETGLGLFRSSAGVLGFAAGGGSVATISATAFNLSIDLSTTGNLLRSVASAVTATGTTQGDATILTEDISVVTSSSGSALGVILPNKTGAEFVVFNNTVNAINVYPASGGTIDFRSANVAYSLPSHARISFVSYAANTWITLNASLV
jgi:hypothetical protein